MRFSVGMVTAVGVLWLSMAGACGDDAETASSGAGASGGSGGPTGTGGSATSTGGSTSTGAAGNGGAGGMVNMPPPVCSLTGSPTTLTTAQASSRPELVALTSGVAVAWNEAVQSSVDTTVMWATLDANLATVVSPTAVPDNGGVGWDPALEFNGSHVAMMWVDDRNGTADLFFTRFDIAGTKVGGVDVPVVVNADSEEVPDIAWDGSGYGYVWHRENEPKLYFGTIEADGAERQAGSVIVSVSSGVGGFPTIAWDGQQFGIGFHASTSLIGTTIYFLTENGPITKNKLHDNGSTIPQGHPPAMVVGTAFNLVWKPGSTSDFINYGWASDDTTGGMHQPSMNDNPRAGMGLAWDGNYLGLAFRDGADNLQFVLKREGNGALVNDEVSLATGIEGTVDLVWAGDHYVVAYEVAGDIVLGRVDCVQP